MARGGAEDAKNMDALCPPRAKILRDTLRDKL